MILPLKSVRQEGSGQGAGGRGNAEWNLPEWLWLLVGIYVSSAPWGSESTPQPLLHQCQGEPQFLMGELSLPGMGRNKTGRI